MTYWWIVTAVAIVALFAIVVLFFAGVARSRGRTVDLVGPPSVELVDGEFVQPDGTPVVAAPSNPSINVPPVFLANTDAVNTLPLAKNGDTMPKVKSKRYRVVVYEAKDGYRWRLTPAHGGRAVDASSEAFTRRTTAVANARRTLGAALPAKIGDWDTGSGRNVGTIVTFIER